MRHFSISVVTLQKHFGLTSHFRASFNPSRIVGKSHLWGNIRQLKVVVKEADAIFISQQEFRSHLLSMYSLQKEKPS